VKLNKKIIFLVKEITFINQTQLLQTTWKQITTTKKQELRSYKNKK